MEGKLNTLSLAFDKYITELNAMAINTTDEDVEEIWDDIMHYFEGSIRKALIWLGTENSVFSGKKPIDLITSGRASELKKFLDTAFNTLVQ